MYICHRIRMVNLLHNVMFLIFKINRVSFGCSFFSLFRFATLHFTMRNKDQERGETLHIIMEKTVTNKKSELDLDRQFGNYIERYEDLYNKEGDIPNFFVCDYIAGMTDNYALNAMKQIKIPKPISFNLK